MRLSRFEEEDDVRYLPLGGEVVEEKDCIEEVGEKFDADRGQFVEDFTCDEVVSGGFVRIEPADGCLDIGRGKSRRGQV
jgi:hypothetical protein